MSWSLSSRPEGPQTFVYQVRSGPRPATWAQVVTALRESPDLREALSEGIGSGPFKHVFWECCPLTAAREHQPFAFALVNATAHARTVASPLDFREHLDRDPAPVVAFPNLSGDATLIVPRPLGAHEHYGDLSRFLRGAPVEQRHALWEAVGRAIQANATRPLWVSTAGLGAPWLHVRLDSRPKYYRHGPYRNP